MTSFCEHIIDYNEQSLIMRTTVDNNLLGVARESSLYNISNNNSSNNNRLLISNNKGKIYSVMICSCGQSSILPIEDIFLTSGVISLKYFRILDNSIRLFSSGYDQQIYDVTIHENPLRTDVLAFPIQFVVFAIDILPTCTGQYLLITAGQHGIIKLWDLGSHDVIR